MANKFVWSGATGLNDGSSWADAYTSLMRDWGAEASFTEATDFVYVRSVHAETSATTLTLTGETSSGTTLPVRILSVAGDTTGTDPGALTAGAQVTTTNIAADIVIEEGLYIYGVNFTSENDIEFNLSSTRASMVLENSNVALNGTSTGDLLNISSTSNNGHVRWVDVDTSVGNASQRHIVSGPFSWWGGSAANATEFVEIGGNRTAVMDLHNLDLSLISNTLVDSNSSSWWFTAKFERCLLHASASKIPAAAMDDPDSFVEFYHCQSGTDADPAFQLDRYTDRGRVVTDSSRYRTGGASDGVRTNPVSWDLNTVTGSKRSYPGHPLVSFPIAGWTAGNGSTAHTYRIYFASDATINDDQLWFELVGPNDAATNSLGVLKTTRRAPLGTPAAYTTDGTSTWTGSGVTTKQYMEITYTPDKAGPIQALVYMAKASDNIYIDPKVYIDP